ncbi:MAG: hypothetical protein FIA94_15120 [Nitrospirae bacterium]|nr:hypothetical protein [Nitrospirota bacterium]
MMRKILAYCFTGCLLLLAVVSCSQDRAGKTESKERADEKTEALSKSLEASKKIVAAKVNGPPIMMNDLIERMNQIAPRYVRNPQETSPDIDRKVKKEALEILIFRELAVQEALRQGIKVPRERVDGAIKKIRDNPGTEEAFKKSLNMSGNTEASFRKQVERNLLFDMIADKEIYRMIPVDEQKVREIYERDKAKFVVPQTLVEDVFIARGADEAAARKKAEEIRALIRRYRNDLTKLHPDTTFMIREGLISGAEYPDIQKTIARLNVGDVSDLIREDDGFHIVKVKEKQAKQAVPMPYEEARELIANDLRMPRVEKRKQEWEARLRKNARIEIMTNIQDGADTDRTK